MGRKLILLVFVSMLAISSVAFASGIDGAETVGKGKFGIGVNQDFIFSRDGKYTGGMELAPGETLNMNSDEEIYRTMAKCSYGLLEGLDIYGMIGIANFESTLPWTSNIAGQTVGKFKFKGKTGLAYGVGIKAVHDFEDWIILGCDVQYLMHKNGFKSGILSVDGWPVELSVGGNASFMEWQVAPYIAKRFGNFVPYLGGKYSDVRVKYKLDWGDGNIDTGKFKAKNNFGMFSGLTWNMTDYLRLNVEGRFFDETAMNFSLALNF